MSPSEPIYVDMFGAWEPAVYGRATHNHGETFHQAYVTLNGGLALMHFSDEEVRTVEEHTKHLLTE